jgi:hypothetical protein
MRRRDFILTGRAALIFALPVLAGAEIDPRWNGTYDKLGQEPHDAEKCGCRTRFAAELEQSEGLHWVHNSGVDWRSQRVNPFRVIRSAPPWQARAFPGSVGRIHGFHGRRGHGRRW